VLHNRIGLTALFIFMLLLIAACGKETKQEKIYNHLEGTVTLEKEFEKEQKKINELELKDQELYEEIINLGMDDFDKIVELSDEAIGYLDERLEHLQSEKESIDASKKEFLKIDNLIKELEAEEERQAKEMYDAMLDRYEAYDQVFEVYTTSIQLTKQLYELLQEEEIEEKQVVTLITKVNDSYLEVIASNEEFNDATVKYNRLKQEFYKTADLDGSSENKS